MLARFLSSSHLVKTMQADPQPQVHALLSRPDVREETRVVFASLLAHCEDVNRLCGFLLESIDARLVEYASDKDAGWISSRPFEHSQHSSLHTIEEERARLQSEALSEEAQRWLADFFLFSTNLETC